jgi:NAD dependent epimerase/dehydratase family enzyme
MRNKKIVIAGGSGFIGQAIAKYFGKENDIVIIGRNAKHHDNNFYDEDKVKMEDGYRVKYLTWDAILWENGQEHWKTLILLSTLQENQSIVVITRSNGKRLLKVALNATRIIGEAIRACVHPPKLWINAASATIYRNTFDRPNDEYNGIISEVKRENMPWSLLDRIRYRKNRLVTSVLYGKNSNQYQSLDLDFSIQVCKQWEKIFFDQRTPFTRKVALRTAITLGARRSDHSIFKSLQIRFRRKARRWETNVQLGAYRRRLQNGGMGVRTQRSGGHIQLRCPKCSHE